MKKFKLKNTRKILSIVGKNSFIIYVVSQFIINIVITYVTSNMGGVNYLLCVVNTIWIILVSFGIKAILKKNKITRFLFLGEH